MNKNKNNMLTKRKGNDKIHEVMVRLENKKMKKLEQTDA